MDRSIAGHVNKHYSQIDVVMILPGAAVEVLWLP